MSQSSGRLMPMRQKAMTDASQLPAHCLQTGATSKTAFPYRHMRCPEPSTCESSRQHNGPQWPTTGKALPGMNQYVVDTHGVVCRVSLRSRTIVVSRDPVYTSSRLHQASQTAALASTFSSTPDGSISHTNRLASGVTALGTSPVMLTRPS
jgi:hypothetical protein